MQSSRETYASIHRLLEKEGVVILHTSRVPINPVNLFDLLLARSSGVVVEVDEDFISEVHDRARDPAHTS